MNARISLALAIHNHQPVGNFGWVYGQVHDQAYEPMIAALERHPTVRLALHYSGPLLSWLREERPTFVDRLAALVARGQVEILGGGWYEPVLVALPERDRAGQLSRMADELEATFGRRPSGAWLAERVWEPDLPRTLVDAGYAWTILDDAHFRAAAVAEDDLWGSYVTEDQGRLLTVFGTERGLRYRIPFREVDEVIDHLRGHATGAGDRLGTMGDDGEKFGAWPGTFERCWGRTAWVERFFTALEANADWLSTVTPSDWLETHGSIGRVYVPTSSYAEMGEWSLPTDEALAFGAAVRRAEAAGRPEVRWLRGGFWRNFQVKYREVNDLHKQMLRVSERVAAMAAGPARDRAVDELQRGQSNDCYWHGLFGGVYISHMRLATHGHLIAAEDAAEAELGIESGLLSDLDLDGRPEVRLANAGQVVVVSPHEGAGIGVWDVRAARHALTAVMRRRREPHHGAIASDAWEPSDGPDDRTGHAAGREPALAERLVIDAYERRSALIHLLAPDARPEEFAAAGATELLDRVDGPFDVERLEPDRVSLVRDGLVLDQPVRLRSTIAIAGGRLDPVLSLAVQVANGGARPLVARLGIELATTLLGGGGNPAAWWEIRGDRSSHDATRSADAVDRLAAGNDQVGVALEIAAEPAADAWISPIETISNSETGIERAYQGSALLLGWPVRLEPGSELAVNVRLGIVVARDRALERGPTPGWT